MASRIPGVTRSHPAPVSVMSAAHHGSFQAASATGGLPSLTQAKQQAKQQAMPAARAVAKATGEHDAYARLFARLRSAELFFNAKRDDAGGVTTQLVDVGPGLKAVLFFTSKAGKGLRQPFAGIPWKDGLKMVIAGSSNGLVVQNEADDWIAIDKPKAAQRLAEIEAATPPVVTRDRG